MSSITGTSSTNTALLTTSSQAEAANSEKSDSEADGAYEAETTGINTDKADTVKISTRAEKIQKLNEEFFAAGPRAFQVTPEFINRLEEYGLITANEADKLGGNAIRSTQGAKTVAELSVFIEGFIESVKQVAPSSPLIETLQQAQTVLDNFNTPTAQSLAINIPEITLQIKQYNESETDQLPEADQESFNQLLLVLGAANVLTPGKNTTAEIEQYIAVNRG